MLLAIDEEDFRRRLFGDLSFDDFKEQYFRRTKYLVKCPIPGYYSKVFGDGDLTKILSGTMLHRPAVRMVSGGHVLPMSEFSRSIPYGVFSFEHVVDVRKVELWYQRGYTINVRGAHFNHAGLASSVRVLKELFACNVRANLYLTPTGERGLSPHYDVHDVIVIQVSGSKRWSFYERNYLNPTDRLRFDNTSFDVGNVTEEIDLDPGDLLYIPRGISHAATSSVESLHVTLGIEEPTFADLLRMIADSIESEPSLRASFEPERVLLDGSYRDQVRSLLVEVISQRLSSLSMMQIVAEFDRMRSEDGMNRDCDFLHGL